ncbi:MAG TPA: hypothetical protein VN436_08860, partial [Holophaga sp.]|nr:hypothetical protein [Holophaga sp.]
MLPNPRPPCRIIQRRRLLLSSAVALGLALGCARLPRTGSLPQPRVPESFEASLSFSAPAMDWPTGQWWL